MSQFDETDLARIEVATALFAAWSSGDVDAPRPYLTDDPVLWDSVGGLVVTTLGRVPKPGEQVEVGGLVLRAERVTGRRIGSLRVTKVEPDDEGDDDERRAAETGASGS